MPHRGCHEVTGGKLVLKKRLGRRTLQRRGVRVREMFEEHRTSDDTRPERKRKGGMPHRGCHEVTGGKLVLKKRLGRRTLQRRGVRVREMFEEHRTSDDTRPERKRKGGMPHRGCHEVTGGKRVLKKRLGSLFFSTPVRNRTATVRTGI